MEERSSVPSGLFRWSCSVFLVALSLSPAPSMGQLPPKIEMDRFLLQAEQAVAKGNTETAKKAMEQVLHLQQKHGIRLRPRDHFRRAKVGNALEEWEQTIDSLTEYLDWFGRRAPNYFDALQLMSDAKTEKKAEAAASGSGSAEGAAAKNAATNDDPCKRWCAVFGVGPSFGVDDYIDYKVDGDKLFVVNNSRTRPAGFGGFLFPIGRRFGVLLGGEFGTEARRALDGFVLGGTFTLTSRAIPNYPYIYHGAQGSIL